MKPMTNTELNMRIAQFIERKKESFPDIFDDPEIPRQFEARFSSPDTLTGRGLGSARPRYS